MAKQHKFASTLPSLRHPYHIDASSKKRRRIKGQILRHDLTIEMYLASVYKEKYIRDMPEERIGVKFKVR